MSKIVIFIFRLKIAVFFCYYFTRILNAVKAIPIVQPMDPNSERLAPTNLFQWQLQAETDLVCM
jgi:hypothetical protein